HGVAELFYVLKSPVQRDIIDIDGTRRRRPTGHLIPHAKTRERCDRNANSESAEKPAWAFASAHRWHGRPPITSSAGSPRFRVRAVASCSPLRTSALRHQPALALQDGKIRMPAAYPHE